jgi:hypothetical protein
MNDLAELKMIIGGAAQSMVEVQQDLQSLTVINTDEQTRNYPDAFMRKFELQPQDLPDRLQRDLVSERLDLAAENYLSKANEIKASAENVISSGVHVRSDEVEKVLRTNSLCQTD